MLLIHSSKITHLAPDTQKTEGLAGNLFLALQTVVSFSTFSDAAQEILYGNAGRMAALISARRLGASHSIASPSTIEALAVHIIEQGRKGTAYYVALHGPIIPLM